MAEIEIGIMNRQCQDRRIEDADLMRQEIAAWEEARNANRARIHWRFTITAARVKLERLSPSNQGCGLLVASLEQRINDLVTENADPRRQLARVESNSRTSGGAAGARPTAVTSPTARPLIAAARSIAGTPDPFGSILRPAPSSLRTKSVPSSAPIAALATSKPRAGSRITS
jgi:hypothetical protein